MNLSIPYHIFLLVLSWKIGDMIRKQYGNHAVIKVIYLILIEGIILGIITSDILMICLSIFLIWPIYILNHFSIKYWSDLYKKHLPELLKLDAAGWGKTYRANLLRGELSEIWTFIPEKQKQEILEWEKNI